MNSENTSPLSDQQEQALDVLLTEIHGAPAPDLSQRILMQLGSPSMSAAVKPTVEKLTGDSSIRVRRRSRKSNRSLKVVASVVAVVAASAIALVWMRSGTDKVVVDTAEQVAVSNAPAIRSDDDAGQLQTFDQQPLKPKSRKPVPLRPPGGVPMLVDLDVAPDSPGLVKAEMPTQLNRTQLNRTQLNRSQQNHALRSIADASQQVERSVKGYWKAVGITPTAEANADTVAERLTSSLGVDVSSVSIADAQALREKLVSGGNAKQIALRWLNEITESGADRLQADARKSLVAEISNGFQSKEPFGQTMAGLLSGESKVSPAFYTAVSYGGHDPMVRRLASVTMNVDLRCTKCHDAKIEGSGRQESYWAFSTFINRGLSQDGRWSPLGANAISQKPAFYELSDGRQRFVEPKVSTDWLNSRSGSEPADIPTWSSRLATSPELARGLVNSLWRMVHGRPLRGHVIDTIAAPHDAMLDQLENQLSSDLLQSDFDIARTLALVIASPVTRRSVPGALLQRNALTASDADIRAAMNTVNAFAAAMPRKSDLSMGRRLDIAMRSVGGRINDLNGADSLLANIASVPSVGGNRQKTAAKIEVTGYPSKATDLPAQWLSSIKSYQERVDHLGYLAGMSEVPQPVRQAAMMLGEKGKDQALALTRVWWLLQPR